VKYPLGRVERKKMNTRIDFFWEKALFCSKKPLIFAKNQRNCNQFSNRFFPNRILFFAVTKELHAARRIPILRT